MTLIDYLIVLIPTLLVIGLAVYSRRYIRGVADFLSAGRVCGRYVICVGDVANALSIIGLTSYIEMHYKTGFGVYFWRRVMAPIGLLIALSGFFLYRFRETKAMSLGQFLELRYNRSLRIFASSLRTLSEILCNVIMPAITARFFIYFLDLPRTFTLLGLEIPTYMALVVACLCVAVGIIWAGGTLSLIITDALQGIMCFPILLIITGFFIHTFSWSNEVVPTIMDRVQGESFVNPFDVSKLRDFNLFLIVVLIYNSIMNKGAWIGGGATTAAKSPHEQKMAGILGTWRNMTSGPFYVFIAVMIITLMANRHWAPEAQSVRYTLSSKIAEEMIADPAERAQFKAQIEAVPVQEHRIGVDEPLSQEQNTDTPTLDAAHEAFNALKGESEGNAAFQEYRTLYHQLMMAVSMRNLLPTGLMGLFCLLMVLMMISTDDTRIYSSAMTLTQDLIMPLRKKPFAPKQHLWVLRWVSVGVAVCYVIGSLYMAQLDYIQLFLMIMGGIWMAGSGPMLIFGLYGRFGTTAGAFSSLLSGMALTIGGILVKRNWPATVYPWLVHKGWAAPFGRFLETVSKPLNPYVVWTMDPVKFPINSVEMYFMISLLSVLIYCVVSRLTRKEPFNLDRMLHRGKYNLDGDTKERLPWTLRNLLQKLIGITEAYTKGDRILARSVFFWSMGWGFCLNFIVILVWNIISPWPDRWWANYFVYIGMSSGATLMLITSIWFGIGGVRDLRRLFRDLKERLDDPLDDGWVEGHVSLADKAKFEKIEHERVEKLEEKQ